MLIAAVHNGELRSSPAQGIIDQVGTHVEVIECVDQPPLQREVDTQALRRWATHQWTRERQWRRYLGQHSLFRDLLGRLGEARWRARLASRPSLRDQAWRTRQVETFVTAKHISAWRQFLDGPWEVLMVLESDATALPHTAEGLVKALERIAIEQPVYVNLAGGLDTRKLGLTALRSSSDDFGHTYDRAVSNTCCAYLLTRTAAEQLVRHLDAHPTDATLSIDWLCNVVFATSQSHGAAITCIHADPPVIAHGSRTGLTRSWHPER